MRTCSINLLPSPSSVAAQPARANAATTTRFRAVHIAVSFLVGGYCNGEATGVASRVDPLEARHHGVRPATRDGGKWIRRRRRHGPLATERSIFRNLRALRPSRVTSVSLATCM